MSIIGYERPWAPIDPPEDSERDDRPVQTEPRPVSKALVAELRDRGCVLIDGTVYRTADNRVLFTGDADALRAWLDGEDSPPLTQTAFERIEREERRKSRAQKRSA